MCRLAFLKVVLKLLILECIKKPSPTTLTITVGTVITNICN